MKKGIFLLISALLVSVLVSCSTAQPKEVPSDFADAQSVIEYLEAQNRLFVQTGKNNGDISKGKLKDTAENGQKPYAVIITCSDSRVPAEHVFNAGVGELFVIRTAGNVIGDHALGSVEYGVEHLGAKLVVVLGHTNCGAVDAALSGGAHGHIKTITDEIISCLPSTSCSAQEAEILNVQNSISRIMASEIVREMAENGKTLVVGAIYDIESGEVVFLD